MTEWITFNFLDPIAVATMPFLTPKFNSNCNNIDYYLAGLIEGDGSIKIPKTVRSEKGKLLYPSVTIVFAAKDLPLAQYISKSLTGTVNKAKGDYFVLSIYFSWNHLNNWTQEK